VNSAEPRRTLTLRELLRETVAQFDRARVDSPAFTARTIVAHALGRPREWLTAHDDARPDAADIERLNALVARVVAHEPMAYILGHREFYGIDLLVDPRVLIPRPETEMLVELALEHLRHFPSPLDLRSPLPYGERAVDVIDVGTGSGAVAIAVAAHAPAARVLATDISAEALDVARTNAERSGVCGRIEFAVADLLTDVDCRARVITANLPYVTAEEIDILPPEIQAHEPRVALDGGTDGLELVRRLLAQLDAHLLPAGAAYFEIGAYQGQAALQAARTILPGWRVELGQDLAKLDRVLKVVKWQVGRHARATENNPRMSDSTAAQHGVNPESSIVKSKSSIELIAFDLDGTVLNAEFKVSPRVLAALHAAVQRGVRVTIATGRPVPVTRPFAEMLGVNAPVLAMQGGLIYDLASETTLHELTLPHELACAILDLEREHPAWQAVSFIGDSIHISSIRYPPDFYTSLLGANLQVHADLCAALDKRDPDKILFVVPPEDAPAGLAELRRIVGDRATVVQSHALFVEANPLEAHKGAGLARLAADLGIPRERVMAIGDQDNDATMIAWAGLGVAMANGSPAAKAAANWIAPPIGEDGAAIAIERFVLGA
jgi:release factor glutamine methyltransferase